MKDAFTTAVIIPARNEERRIVTCLSALAPQIDQGVLVVVVANNCTDQTVRLAQGIIPRGRFELLDCTLPPSQGVGEARQRGCVHAMTNYPDIQILMTTDADCVVTPDWIARNCNHLSEVDVVCGGIDPIPSETAILSHMPSTEGMNEAIYRDLVILFYSLISPESYNPYPHHGEAAGASLACRASVWQSIGGFADLRRGEDRDFIRRVRNAGFRVRHADDVRIHASCRLQGRAAGGMADALRQRLAGVNYLVDEALPPVADLIEGAKGGRLASWPPDTPDTKRLRPADLPHEIKRLQHLIERIKAARDALDKTAGIKKDAMVQTEGAAPQVSEIR